MNEIRTCRRCHTPIEETDNFCRACGRSLKQGYSFWFTHTGIILLALLAGPFALPFVWMSKVISPVAKWIYSAVLLLIGYYFALTCYKLFLLIQSSMSILTQGF